MKNILVVCVFLGAFMVSCKKKAADTPDAPVGVPPPIAKGVCLAEHYTGAIAEKQSCAFNGYMWRCDATSCDRGVAVTAERPMWPEPVDALVILPGVPDAHP